MRLKTKNKRRPCVPWFRWCPKESNHLFGRISERLRFWPDFFAQPFLAPFIGSWRFAQCAPSRVLLVEQTSLPRLWCAAAGMPHWPAASLLRCSALLRCSGRALLCWGESGGGSCGRTHLSTPHPTLLHPFQLLLSLSFIISLWMSLWKDVIWVKNQRTTHVIFGKNALHALPLCLARQFATARFFPGKIRSNVQYGHKADISIKNPFQGSCIDIKLNFWDRQLNMRVSEVISASKFSIGHKVDSEVCYAVACFRTKDTFHLSWIWPKRVANNRSTYEYTRSKESLFVWQMSYLEGVLKVNLEMNTLHAP